MSSRGKRYHMISWVAEHYQIHPQTLRLYEREGLINPPRSVGNTRLYDEQTCRRLETILTLTRDLGVNLAGVEVVLKLKDQIEALKAEVGRLMAERERENIRGVARANALVPMPRAILITREDE